MNKDRCFVSAAPLFDTRTVYFNSGINYSPENGTRSKLMSYDDVKKEEYAKKLKKGN